MDLEKLNLEEVDKEMAADEAAQSSATETNAPKNAPNTDGVVADAWTQHLEEKKEFLSPSCFCAHYVLGLFVNLILEQFSLRSYFGSNIICPVFMGH